MTTTMTAIKRNDGFCPDCGYQRRWLRDGRIRRQVRTRRYSLINGRLRVNRRYSR